MNRKKSFALILALLFGGLVIAKKRYDANN